MRRSKLALLSSTRVGVPLVLGALVLLLGWFATRGGVVDPPPRLGARLDPQERGAPGEHGLPGASGSARRPSSTEAQARSSAGAEGEPGHPEREESCWLLVAQLRELARDPSTFHARALPVIDELKQTCARQLAEQTERQLREPAEPLGPQALEELLAKVVRASAEPGLVRAAVLLAIDTLLHEGEFLKLFAAWVDPAGDAPPELVRAAAIAAARRGETTYCDDPVDLGYLAKLEGQGNAGLPGLFPLRLARVVRPREAALLADWIEANAARHRALVQDPQASAADAAEHFVTSELLFVLWGHRALLDPEVQERVVAECTRGPEQRAAGELIYFRAAHFLVHSLALCNVGLFDLAVELGASRDPANASIAESMQGLVVGGLGVALLAKLERLRHSVDPSDLAELELSLLEVGDALRGRGDPSAVAEACSYLDELAADVSLGETARACALKAVVAAGSWPALQASARSLLATDAPDLLQAIALDALVAQAQGDETMRKELLELLESIQGTSAKPWLQQEIDAYLAQLSK